MPLRTTLRLLSGAMRVLTADEDRLEAHRYSLALAFDSTAVAKHALIAITYQSGGICHERRRSSRPTLRPVIRIVTTDHWNISGDKDFRTSAAKMKWAMQKHGPAEVIDSDLNLTLDLSTRRRHRQIVSRT